MPVMSNASKKAVVVGVAIAIGGSFLTWAASGAADYTARAMQNPPPWVGQGTYESTSQKLLEQLLSQSVKSAWWRCINAVESGQSQQVVDALSQQLAEEKLTYFQQTGKPHPLDCPMATQR